ncbi:MAG: T9SS type A sorting domain-containing protein, partial [Saprospiraceae bacterium]|nr:T9SS type A sorting domain-containing protein [Saprospiraceae bacterium]
LSVQLAELQPVRCKGGTDGWISVQAAGGTGNYTYTWNTGTSGATISNLSSGTYTVVVSDGVSEVQLSVVISEPSVPFLVSLSSTATNCSTNEPNGAITGTLSGGAPPYTYLWSNGATTPALAGLSAGVYAVTVTDGNGCHAIGSATVLQSPPLHLELFPEGVSCHSGNDGAIFTTVSGGALPYSYAWSTGSAMGWVNHLAAGAYSLTVTDANGCSVQQSAGVAQPQPLVPVALATPATNGANGSIFLEVNGGTAPYSYMWSNGATTQNLNGLSPGTYTVIVTDSHGCIGATSASVILGETPGLSYCIARGSNTNFEWIYSVQIGDYLNISGNNGGYGNFTASVPIPLSIGTTYPLLLTPLFQNNPFNESWRIWLDLNHDGDFLDAGELLFQPGLTNQPVSGSIQIPAGATPGVTRMRIAMKYGSPANACGVFAYGEVEDYTVFISNNGGNLALAPGNALTEQAHALQHGPLSDVDAENFTPAFRQESSNPDFSLFPNPAATGYVICRYVSIDNGNGKISIFDAEGRVVKNQNLNIESGENRWELVLDGLSSGIYYVQIDNGSHPMRQTLVVIGH